MPTLPKPRPYHNRLPYYFSKLPVCNAHKHLNNCFCRGYSFVSHFPNYQPPFVVLLIVLLFFHLTTSQARPNRCFRHSRCPYYVPVHSLFFGCVPLIQDRGDPSGLISLKDRGFLQGCIHRVRSRVHVCTDNRSDHHRGH